MSRPDKLLLVLSFVGFIALGLPDAVIGVAWTALRTYFDLPQDALGPRRIGDREHRHRSDPGISAWSSFPFC